MLSMQDFTPTEQRILTVLLNQGRQPRQSLVDCVSDNEGTAFSAHMAHLRKKLRARGYTVAVIMVDRQTFYELARVVASNASE